MLQVVVSDVNPNEIETTQIVMGSRDALQVRSLRSRLIVSRDYFVDDNSVFVIIIAKKEKERYRRDVDPGVLGASGSLVLRQVCFSVKFQFFFKQNFHSEQTSVGYFRFLHFIFQLFCSDCCHY